MSMRDDLDAYFETLTQKERDEINRMTDEEVNLRLRPFAVDKASKRRGYGCPECGGTGWLVSGITCDYCSGSGVIPW